MADLKDILEKEKSRKKKGGKSYDALAKARTMGNIAVELSKTDPSDPKGSEVPSTAPATTHEIVILITPLQEKILDFLKEHEGEVVARRHIQKALGISPNTSRDVFNKFKKHGILEQVEQIRTAEEQGIQYKINKEIKTKTVDEHPNRGLYGRQIIATTN